MECTECHHVIPETSMYCAYCGHPQQRAHETALVEAHANLLRSKGLIEGNPAVDTRPMAVGEAAGIIFQAAQNLVRDGADSDMTASVAATLVEGVFFDRLKRIRTPWGVAGWEEKANEDS